MAALLSGCSLTFLPLTSKVVNEFALIDSWDRIAGFAGCFKIVPLIPCLIPGNTGVPLTLMTASAVLVS
ncbi:hypothetical protein V5799_033662 [Amblyomma americanum]|uniref:Uncharacterized protein n=1 Tax=Amblyomma americanum TaxID=6943 RepID=A0AAQ4DMP3_AMBAM